jgi:hypothetical protein
MIISIANSGKSPLSPPFDDAQGMLFQRGELAVERAELPNTYEQNSTFLLGSFPL